MTLCLRRSLIVLVLAGAAGLAAVFASVTQAEEVDARAAREAAAAGRIQPLTTLLSRLETECRGRFVEMELDEDDDVWIYEIKWLGPAGDVAELEYDAGTLAIIEAEGARLDALGCIPPGTPD